MGRMVVTNCSGGQNDNPVGIQLTEVPDDTPIPGQPVVSPQGNTVLSLVLTLAEAQNYPIGSQWDMNLTRVTTSQEK